MVPVLIGASALIGGLVGAIIATPGDDDDTVVIMKDDNFDGMFYTPPHRDPNLKNSDRKYFAKIWKRGFRDWNKGKGKRKPSREFLDMLAWEVDNEPETTFGGNNSLYNTAIDILDKYGHGGDGDDLPEFLKGDDDDEVSDLKKVVKGLVIAVSAQQNAASVSTTSRPSATPVKRTAAKTP